MRRFLTLTLTVFLATPALAWVPALDPAAAKRVIDAAYNRTDPVSTYQELDLGIKDGKFLAGDGVVKVHAGGDKCLSNWLTGAPAGGSRPDGITVSGQADQLFTQSTDLRDNFEYLSVADALGTELAAKRLPTAQLRVDMHVRGLPAQKAREAYQVRLKAPGGKLLAPARRSYVNDFKQEGNTWSGTLVFYFEPLKAGLGANDRAELLLRTEADTNCAHNIALNLASFL